MEIVPIGGGGSARVDRGASEVSPHRPVGVDESTRFKLNKYEIPVNGGVSQCSTMGGFVNGLKHEVLSATFRKRKRDKKNNDNETSEKRRSRRENASIDV